MNLNTGIDILSQNLLDKHSTVRVAVGIFPPIDNESNKGGCSLVIKSIGPVTKRLLVQIPDQLGETSDHVPFEQGT